MVSKRGVDRSAIRLKLKISYNPCRLFPEYRISESGLAKQSCTDSFPVQDLPTWQSRCTFVNTPLEAVILEIFPSLTIHPCCIVENVPSYSVSKLRISLLQLYTPLLKNAFLRISQNLSLRKCHFFGVLNDFFLAIRIPLLTNFDNIHIVQCIFEKVRNHMSIGMNVCLSVFLYVCICVCICVSIYLCTHSLTHESWNSAFYLACCSNESGLFQNTLKINI